MSIEGTPESHPSVTGAYNEPPARKRVWVRIVVYLVLVCAVGFVVWRIFQNQKQGQASTARQAAALMNRPVPVQAMAVQQKPMPIFLTALGTVTPNFTVTVKARVSGQLLPVKFIEGQEVRQGQTIMVIDPRPYKAALDQAKGTLAHDQALLTNAKVQYDRYMALYKAGVVSKEVMQTDEATMGQYEGAIASDNAAVENAQLQLSWCSIQAPISGRIGLRLVDPGNIITANTTNLVIINQFQPIAVYFTLPENQLPPVLAKLRANHILPVAAYDKADLQKLADGQLLTADNQIDTTTGTAKLKALFANTNDILFPNQFVNIHLVLENRPNALVVPSAAIQTGIQGQYVWVVATDADGKMVARIQPVKVALAEGQQTILDSGVTAGMKVVVDGAERLRAGSQVIVSGAQNSGQSGSAGPAQAEGDQSGDFATAPGAAAGSGKGNGQHKHQRAQQ